MGEKGKEGKGVKEKGKKGEMGEEGKGEKEKGESARGKGGKQKAHQPCPVGSHGRLITLTLCLPPHEMLKRVCHARLYAAQKVAGRGKVLSPLQKPCADAQLSPDLDGEYRGGIFPVHTL